MIPFAAHRNEFVRKGSDIALEFESDLRRVSGHVSAFLEPHHAFQYSPAYCAPPPLEEFVSPTSALTTEPGGRENFWLG